MSKMLIVYYSFTSGNTKRIAEQLQNFTGADIAEIETIVPYTGSYEDIVSQGQDEVQSGYMPEIKPLGVDLTEYDTIAIGTPTWWYTMAPAVLTFLRENNFNGKTVIPFMTNAGWAGHVIKDIKKECEGATFAKEIEIRFSANDGERDRMMTPEKTVADWIEQVKALTV